MNFEQLGLSEKVLKALADINFTTPTPIQEKSIPTILMGNDLLGCAQTGTGKTGAFCLPMIDILSHGKAKARLPRCVILTPTRELADQIEKNFINFTKHQKLTCALIIGGTSMPAQEKKIAGGVDVLIATPGRLLDLIKRGKLLLNDVKILVIDEADRMLDMGFIPDVEALVAKMPAKRQTLMFTATLAPEIKKLAAKFLNHPKEVMVSAPSSTAKTVKQFKITTPAKHKAKALTDLLSKADWNNVIVFCNRKRDIDTLVRGLQKNKVAATAIHGDLTQLVRQKTMDQFKANEFRFLVASDVVARGIDIQGLTCVINYDVPRNPEDYVHRIGRTGRAGKDGLALTLIVPDDDDKSVAAIEKLIDQKLAEFPGLDGIQEPAKPIETKTEATQTQESDDTQKQHGHRDRHRHPRHERRHEPRHDNRRDHVLQENTKDDDRCVAMPQDTRPQHSRRHDQSSQGQTYIENGFKITRIEKVFVHKTGHVIPPMRHSRALIDPEPSTPDATTSKGFGDETPPFFGK